MKRIVLFCLMAALALALTAPLALAGTRTTQYITHDGESRLYVRYIPTDYTSSTAAPLVVALHPTFSNGNHFANTSGWVEEAEENDFIAVFPQSIDSAFNIYDWTGSPDDIGYLDAVMDEVESGYNIDTDKVYMSGFSSGAMMTISYAFERADRLAAISPVMGGWMSAYGCVDPYDLDPPPAFIPVMQWRGENETQTTGSGGCDESRVIQDANQKAWWMDFLDTGATKTTTVETDATYTYDVETYTAGEAEFKYVEIRDQSHGYDTEFSTKSWDDFFSRFTADPPDIIRPAGLAATAGDATVSLDWDDNAEGDLDGYNVYRGTSEGGAKTKLNASLVSASNYTDNTVSNGNTYYYLVTAVNTSSTESADSREVSASPAGGGPTTIFSDDFEDGDLTGWTTTASVDCDATAAYEGSYGARVRGSGTSYISTSVDASAYDTVNLKYAVSCARLDAGEYVYVEWSTDGSSWTTVESYNTNATWAVRDQSLGSGAAVSTLYIRFRNTGSGAYEDGRVDNVEVVGNTD